MNIGNVFTTGPAEAAFVINELVKPNAVIASHANEMVTKDGKLLPKSGGLQSEAMPRNEECANVGDYRKNDGDHHSNRM